MAKFKIRLITPNNDKLDDLKSLNQEETFLAATITDYDDQRSSYRQQKEEKTALTTLSSDNASLAITNSYTYNEKISLHKHGQKELSFNIDDKILSNNEWIENPFARLLRVGTQLEVTDKYNNCYLFTVNKISYAFNNLNIVYTIDCQDSFTYQLTRQNQGYTLRNDESSTDFIGALNIDNWAKRITKDCYLTYDYIPLEKGIFQDNNGYLNTFNGLSNTAPYKLDTTLANVSKIIKPIYNRDDFSSFYETFPFSVSGSNALAALIALGDTLGLQLNIIEGFKRINAHEPIQYVRLFYFGPVKNSDTSGLSYSPLREVQNFSLNFKGESLTTVLNVKSITVGDEEIGLFPAMPSFFVSQILTNNSWMNSKYYPGYFLELVQGKRFADERIFDTFSQLQTSDSDFVSLFRINTDILSFWPTCYNKIGLRWDNEHITNILSSTGAFSPIQYEMGIAVINNRIYHDYSLFNLITTGTIVEGGFAGRVVLINSDIKFSRNLSDYLFSIDYNSREYIGHLTCEDDYYVLYFLEVAQGDTPYDPIGPVDPSIDRSGDLLYMISDTLLLDPDFIDMLHSDEDTYAIPQEYWETIPTPNQYYPEYQDIPVEILNNFNNGNIDLYFYIKHTPRMEERPGIEQAFIILTRDATQEEWEFAKIAESCPWLENKLIDFNYFVKIGIISKAEYENLMHFVVDDLRIINGQLMCYATSYYESLHKQVQLLADLQKYTDKLGAAFYADIIEPFTTTGNSKLNTSDFINQYDELFNYIKDLNKKEPLLTLNTIISDYFNKYFNAEQRFLKNIYNFRKFFEEPNIYSLNGENLLQHVTYEIDFATPHNNKIVGFNNLLKFIPFTSFTQKGVYEKDGQYATILDVYEWKNNHYILKHIPDWNTYKNFYVPKFAANQAEELNTEVEYNPQNTYFLLAEDFETIFSNEDPNDFETITKNLALSTDVDFKKINDDKRMEGFSGADIAALVRESQLHALKRLNKKEKENEGDKEEIKEFKINMSDFEYSLNNILPSVSLNDKKKYENLKKKLQESRSHLI